jgi:hypothetical protein
MSTVEVPERSAVLQRRISATRLLGIQDVGKRERIPRVPSSSESYISAYGDGIFVSSASSVARMGSGTDNSEESLMRNKARIQISVLEIGTHIWQELQKYDIAPLYAWRIYLLQRRGTGLEKFTCCIYHRQAASTQDIFK